MTGRRRAAGMRRRDGGGGQVVASEDSPGSGQVWLSVICVRALIVPPPLPFARLAPCSPPSSSSQRCRNETRARRANTR